MARENPSASFPAPSDHLSKIHNFPEIRITDPPELETPGSITMPIRLLTKADSQLLPQKMQEACCAKGCPSLWCFCNWSFLLV